jgi:quercetin dioxygenase-like cupin family protein
MELQAGVFVSNVSTDDWEADLEVGGEVHTLCDADGVQAGLSRIQQAPEKPIPFRSEMRETIIILEGSVRIEIAGGATLELKKGDIASLPKGAETLWHVTAPFKEMWVMA